MIRVAALISLVAMLVMGCASKTGESAPKPLNGYAVTYANDPVPNFVCAYSLNEIYAWHNFNFTSVHRDSSFDADCNDPNNSN